MGVVLLLHNERNGTFKDVTEAAGIKSDGFNAGLTFVDYDHDGDIDLYVTRFSGQTDFDPREKSRTPMSKAGRARISCGATMAMAHLVKSPI